MLDMWRATGERRYFDYVEQWADSLINDKGEIHLYNMSDYNLDFINSGKVLFALYKETGKEKYKQAMDVLIRQLSRHPRTTDAVSGTSWSISTRCGSTASTWLRLHGGIRSDLQPAAMD